METTYADSWSDMAQPCDMDLCVMKWKSAWPIFHSPVILPYILKTIWCMYIILSKYESVQPNVWPKTKYRSLWPIFHGPVIVPYTLKTISCMNIIIWDYESVWPDAWPQIKCRSLWPITVHWFCLISWRLFDICTRSMNQYDPTFDLRINVGNCDLYFTVQWFCLISWRLFDICTRSMNQYDPTFDLRINVGNCDLYFMVYLMDECHIFKYATVWHKLSPQNKYVNMTYISWSSDFA